MKSQNFWQVTALLALGALFQSWVSGGVMPAPAHASQTLPSVAGDLEVECMAWTTKTGPVGERPGSDWEPIGAVTIRIGPQKGFSSVRDLGYKVVYRTCTRLIDASKRKAAFLARRQRVAKASAAAAADNKRQRAAEARRKAALRKLAAGGKVSLGSMGLVTKNEAIVRLWVGQQVKVRFVDGKILEGRLVGVLSAAVIIESDGKRRRYDMFNIAELGTAK